MMPADEDRLYHLLPAIYRLRDAERDGPLKALLGVIQGELAVLEADIAALYDNWFIETCDEWTVAYIGDLLGVRDLSDEQHLAYSQRARVANTIGYRRRKGVAAAMERVVQDATGWPARAAEFFELVGATQHIQHLRPGRGGNADLRDRAGLERMGDAFDSTPRRPDVRRVAMNRGRHNVTSVGVYLWRLQSYPLRADACPVPGDGQPGCYTFHPFGADAPLFSRPRSRGDEIRPAETVNLPMPLGMGTLAADLAAHNRRNKGLPEAHQPLESDHYGQERSVAITRDGSLVPPWQIVSMSLDPWRRPGPGKVAIDPTLGRIAFAPPGVGEQESGRVVVTYCYGFSADLGGGPYDRRPSLAAPGPQTWACRVARHGDGDYDSLVAALAAWEAQANPGVILIADSERYDLPAGATINLGVGGALTIQAADGVYPSLAVGGEGSDTTLTVQPASRTAALTLNGLRFAGAIKVAASRPGGAFLMRLIHCALPAGVSADSAVRGLLLVVEHSILGPLRLPAGGAALEARDSILDAAAAPDGLAITGTRKRDPGPRATLERSTVLGAAQLQELPMASEVIFTAPVTVEQRQTGGVRFCYMPGNSLTPPRYRCQPDMALAGAEDKQQVRRRLAPVFTSTRYGEPGYAQLSLGCAAEISAGAEDGSEMGVFHLLHQPQRVASLRAALDEYLPAGLEAGLFYVT